MEGAYQYGGGLFILTGKLKRLKVHLRSWNKEVFGHVKGKIQALKDRVEVLDSKMQNQCSMEMESKFFETKVELDRWIQRKDTRLLQ